MRLVVAFAKASGRQIVLPSRGLDLEQLRTCLGGEPQRVRLHQAQRPFCCFKQYPDAKDSRDL